MIVIIVWYNTKIIVSLQVTDFLRSRGLNESVITKFNEERVSINTQITTVAGWLRLAGTADNLYPWMSLSPFYNSDLLYIRGSF